MDGILLIDNDGLHGDRQISGEAFLKQGRYPIVIEYMQGSNGKSLGASWKGPGFETKKIESDEWLKSPE